MKKCEVKRILNFCIFKSRAKFSINDLNMKAIFTGNVDFNKSAFLNWGTSKNADIENILLLADGFLKASIELAKTCLADNSDKKADVLIFPILTNANHGIELYLKALIWTLNKLLNSQQKIEGKHNIKQMFNTVKGKIKEYQSQNSLNSFNSVTIELNTYIEELVNTIKPTPRDDKMDFSRYPISDKYENHFYVDEISNVEIDLENFITRFEKIRESLDDRSSYYFYQELNQEW